MIIDTTTSSNVNRFFIVAIGTAALSPLSLEVDIVDLNPTANIVYEQLDHQDWELNNNDPLVSIDQIQTLQKVQALKSFSTNLVENSQSLDKETIEIINKNFWDWI